MPKYLFTGTFTQQGGKGVMAEGGSARVKAVSAAFASGGGTLECYYFMFGSDDYMVIGELPDNATAAAVSMRVSSSGAVANRTVVLLTAEEIDRAASVSVAYRAPGG